VAGEGKIIESKQTTSAFCFDYEMLGIDLIRQAEEDISNPYARAEPAPPVNGYANQPVQTEMPLFNKVITAPKDDVPF